MSVLPRPPRSSPWTATSGALLSPSRIPDPPGGTKPNPKHSSPPPPPRPDATTADGFRSRELAPSPPRGRGSPPGSRRRPSPHGRGQPGVPARVPGPLRGEGSQPAPPVARAWRGLAGITTGEGRGEGADGETARPPLGAARKNRGRGGGMGQQGLPPSRSVLGSPREARASRRGRKEAGGDGEAAAARQRGRL